MVWICCQRSKGVSLISNTVTGDWGLIGEALIWSATSLKSIDLFVPTLLS